MPLPPLDLQQLLTKLLQSCPTLCNPIDGSPPGSPVPGILQEEHWSRLPFPSQCMKVKSESEVAQSCLTLHDPKECSLPGCSIHGIFQARVLEWVAIAFSSRALCKNTIQTTYWKEGFPLPQQTTPFFLSMETMSIFILLICLFLPHQFRVQETLPQPQGHSGPQWASREVCGTQTRLPRPPWSGIPRTQKMIVPHKEIQSENNIRHENKLSPLSSTCFFEITNRNVTIILHFS